jgi:hypothetical protein
VKFTVTNEGNASQVWTAADSTVDVGADAYSSDQDGSAWEAMQAYMQYGQPGAQAADEGMNPGSTGPSWAVYQIPAGAHVTGVSVVDAACALPSPSCAQVLVRL